MTSFSLKNEKNKTNFKSLKDNFWCAKEKSKKNKITGSGSTKLNTFSMIKFYESIPEYDEISHLPAYDFSERLNSLKKIHFDISENKYFSSNGRTKRIKSAKRKKRKIGRKISSASKSSNCSQSALDSAHRQSITETDELSSCKRSSSSNSHNSFNSLKQFKSIRNKILAEIDANEKKTIETARTSNTKTPPNVSILKTDNSDKNLTKPNFHHHHHPHSPHRHQHLLQHNHHHQPNVNCHTHHYDFCDEVIHHRYYHHNPHHQQLTFQTDKKTENLTDKVPETADHNEEHDEKLKNDIQISNKILRRSKSCPKNLFSNYFTPDHSKSTKKTPLIPDRQSSLNCDDDNNIQLEIDRIVNGARRNVHSSVKRHVRCKKSPTLSSASRKGANTIEEFLPNASQIVHSNLAANLREQWSRKKITVMTNDRLKPMPQTQFIPKCHRWNVRQSPGWKSFVMEDTKTEKLMREAARREEQRLRQQAHSISMKLMRTRVRSAQLLLEGRALSAK